MPERIIEHIRIPVETLRIAWTGHNRIRLDEAAQRGVVVAGVVKVQAYRAVVALTGELVARRRGPGGVARFAIRIIAQFRNFAAAAVGSERCRSQVIAEQVVQRPRIALTHRHPLTAGIVILDHRARTTGPLEVVADVVGGHATQHGFDAVAVAAGTRYCGTGFMRVSPCIFLQTHKTRIVIVSDKILYYEYKHTYYEDNTYRE